MNDCYSLPVDFVLKRKIRYTLCKKNNQTKKKNKLWNSMSDIIPFLFKKNL